MRAEDCVVSQCPRKADPRVHIVPMCAHHAWEIAHGFRAEMLALAERERDLEQGARHEKRERTAGNREGALVYYMRIGDYIKIGYSARLRNRMRTLRADELLAIEPGGPEVERRRHEQFTAERIDMRRENFRPSPALLEHIAHTHEHYGLPHWATVPRTSIVTTRRKEHS